MHPLKHWFTALAAGPFAFMEVWNNPAIRTGQAGFPFQLFHALWLLPTVLFLAAAPVVNGFSAGERVLARPLPLALRAGFLVFVAAGWLFLLHDQMPCFLGGVPGCD